MTKRIIKIQIKAAIRLGCLLRNLFGSNLAYANNPKIDPNMKYARNANAII